MLRTGPTAAILALALASGSVAGQNAGSFDEQLLSAFTYRNLGPFRMGARASDIAVPALACQGAPPPGGCAQTQNPHRAGPAAPEREHLYTFYVGFWTGGLWKTTNNGTTFEPVFDRQSKLATGDVAVAPCSCIRASTTWCSAPMAAASTSPTLPRSRS